MTKKIHYTVHENGVLVGERRSLDRIYAYAIVVGPDGQRRVFSYCGTFKLANDRLAEARRYQQINPVICITEVVG